MVHTDCLFGAVCGTLSDILSKIIVLYFILRYFQNVFEGTFTIFGAWGSVVVKALRY